MRFEGQDPGTAAAGADLVEQALKGLLRSVYVVGHGHDSRGATGFWFGRIIERKDPRDSKDIKDCRAHRG